MIREFLGKFLKVFKKNEGKSSLQVVYNFYTHKPIKKVAKFRRIYGKPS